MYPRASSQFDTGGNVGISMLGRWAASAGEPWLTMASGNGPSPGGRSTLVCSVLPLEVGSSTISCAAASTVAAGAAFAGNAMIASAGNTQRMATRRRPTFADDGRAGMQTGYRLPPCGASAGTPPLAQVVMQGSLLARDDLGPLRLAGIGCSQPQRLCDDAEDLGVVHLPAHTLAARPGCGQDHVLAGMHVGIDHRRQVAEPKRGTGNALVAFVGDVGVG